MTNSSLVKTLAISLALPFLTAAKPGVEAQALASAAPFIDKANRDWESAIVSGNATVLSAPYAKDGVFIAPDGTAIHGKAGVKTRAGATLFALENDLIQISPA